MAAHTHFPMFIDTTGKHVFVIGGGSIAARRIQTLTQFTFDVTILSEQITDDIRTLQDEGRIHWIAEAYDPDQPDRFADELLRSCLVLACTDDALVNERIGEFCKAHDIPFNRCDAQEESTFWFPAIATNDELVMGLVGNGKSHETVRKAAAELRQIIEDESY